MLAGDPNVTTLCIEDHNQSSLAGMQGQLVPHCDSIGPKPLITGRLDFDRGNEIGQLVDDSHTKVPDHLKIIPCWQTVAYWVNPDTQRSTGAANR